MGKYTYAIKHQDTSCEYITENGFHLPLTSIVRRLNKIEELESKVEKLQGYIRKVPIWKLEEYGVDLEELKQ